MPVYLYKGYNAAGKALSGTRDADSPKALKVLLRRDGVFLTELRESTSVQKREAKSTFKFKFEYVSPQDLATATRQLSTLIGAGIPLVDSLTALIDQIDDESFKSIWSDVKQKVNEGAGFGDSLGAHPRAFSGLYINMVRAGETSGALEVVLSRLADFTESQAELRSKLVGTMIYPIIMMLMAVTVIGILFVFVIPKISMIFTAQKVALPLPTQILIFSSDIAKNYWFVAIPLLIGIVYGFRRYINSKKGRPKWDAFVLKAPVFGPLVRMVAVTRFCRTLGTLVGSGVPLLVAFDIVKNVVQNTILKQVIEDARDAVKEGDNIAASLKRSGEFPPIVTHMIAIGERSGELEEMLNKIARSYDVQVDAKLRGLTSILEPVMIIVMGLVVAFIVISILLPMLQISSFA